jgi:hypothetical protein
MAVFNAAERAKAIMPDCHARRNTAFLTSADELIE